MGDATFFAKLNGAKKGAVPSKQGWGALDDQWDAASFEAALKDAGSKVGPSSDWNAANAVLDVTSGIPLEASAPSGTDLAREFTQMISTQHAYEANAQVVRASDSMLGTLLDVKA